MTCTSHCEGNVKHALHLSESKILQSKIGNSRASQPADLTRQLREFGPFRDRCCVWLVDERCLERRFLHLEDLALQSSAYHDQNIVQDDIVSLN
jgi:hypothetical protein